VVDGLAQASGWFCFGASGLAWVDELENPISSAPRAGHVKLGAVGLHLNVDCRLSTAISAMDQNLVVARTNKRKVLGIE